MSNTIEQIKEWLVGYCGGNASSDFTFKEVAHAISVFIKEEYAGASAMNGSAGVWVTDGSLPKEDGSYFCYLSHDDNFPHEPPIKSSNEYRSKGGWVYLSGWKIIKWLDESVSSPSPLEADPRPIAENYEHEGPGRDGIAISVFEEEAYKQDLAAWGKRHPLEADDQPGSIGWLLQDIDLVLDNADFGDKRKVGEVDKLLRKWYEQNKK